jgi:lactate dehydrogenase-like 2-hydroxyacid dehydrogenase
VIGFDPLVADADWAVATPCVDLETCLLDNSVVFAAPSADARTERTIDGSALDHLPRDSYLTTVGAIDSEAVLTVLNGRRIVGTALDVNEPEPARRRQLAGRPAPSRYSPTHTAGATRVVRRIRAISRRSAPGGEADGATPGSAVQERC